MGIEYFDAHCDTICRAQNEKCLLAKNSLHIDLRRGGDFGAYAQFFAIYAQTRNCGYELFEKRHDFLLQQLRDNEEKIQLCTNADEVKRTVSSGKTAAFLSVEGAEVLGCSVPGLEKAYAAGLRMVALTWNFANDLAGSCVENVQCGLTGQGREFVKNCERLGVIIDVSHISPAAFWDIAKMAEKPFVASHSNCDAVFGHYRNLTDKQIRAIAECGGVVGLNMFADFIGSQDIDGFLRHIDHVLAVGGERCAAIGADFDGCDRLPNGINGIEDIAKVYDAMLQYGFGKQLANRVFWGNLMEVVKKVCVT